MPNERELDEIAELLMTPEAEDSPQPDQKLVEEPEPERPPDTQEAPSEADEPPKTLTAPEFYAQQLPDSDLTYGDFKDRAKDLARADQIRRDAERDRTTFQKQIADLKAAGMLPEMTPELKDQAQQMSQYHQQQQAEIILNNIPDWGNKTTLSADVEAITSHWSRYGYSREEIEQFITNDARFALREKHLLEERQALERAKDKVRAAKVKSAKPTKGRDRDEKGRFESMSNDSSLSKEDRALAALLGGIE